MNSGFSKKNSLGIFAVLASSLLWIFLIAVPLIFLFNRMANDSARLWDPEILATVRLTLNQALLSTFISLLIGLPLGLWAASGRWVSASRIILSLPYSVPTVVAGSAWIAWLGYSGFLGGFWEFWKLRLSYTWGAVILAHVFYNAPWIAVVVANSRMFLPPSLLDAAETLGATRTQKFKFIVWPRIRWALAGALAQVFSLCVMSFALILLLGGGPPVQTLETALFARIRYGTLDVSGAAACAFWELLLTLLPWFLILWAQRRDPGFTRIFSRQFAISRPQPGKAGVGYGVAILGVSALFMLPYLATLPAVTGFFQAGKDFSELRSPLFVSVQLAFWSGIGAVAVALLSVIGAEWLKKWRPGTVPVFLGLMGAPSGISILVLGLGVWLAYGKWLDPFSGSFVAMVLLQIAIFYPMALRMFFPLLGSTPQDLVDAATTLGASPWQAFWAVQWPRWKGPLLGALAIVIGASFGEVAAVSLFYSEQLLPLPVLLSQWTSQYRFEDAQALTALLLLLSVGMTGLVAASGNLGAFFRKWMLD